MRKNKLLKYFSHCNGGNKYIIEYDSALGVIPSVTGLWKDEGKWICTIVDDLLSVYTTRGTYRGFTPLIKDFSKNIYFEVFHRQKVHGRLQVDKMVLYGKDNKEVCSFVQLEGKNVVYYNGEEIANITTNYNARDVYGRTRIEKIGNTIRFYAIKSNDESKSPDLWYTLKVDEELVGIKYFITFDTQGCCYIKKMTYVEY